MSSELEKRLRDLGANDDVIKVVTEELEKIYEQGWDGGYNHAMIMTEE